MTSSSFKEVKHPQSYSVLKQTKKGYHLTLVFEQEVIFFCVREEPVVFLHKDDDFVPYTPRRKENLHENLHGLEKEELVESLELTVRKEVMNTLNTESASVCHKRRVYARCIS